MAHRPAGEVALISVKPEYAERILAGSKRVEFRRAAFGRKVTHLVLYATKPTGRLVAMCEVSRVHRGAPAELWKSFGSVGGIGADRYWAYYRGAPDAVAIGIASVRRLADGLTLSDLGIDGPPAQSYRYVDRGRAERLLTATAGS